MTPEQLVEIPGIGEKMVEKIHQSVAAYFEALDAQPIAPIEPSTEDEAAAEAMPETSVETSDAVETPDQPETAGLTEEAQSDPAAGAEAPSEEVEETTPADKDAAAAVDESAEKQDTPEE
jgi:hypothetical protein